MRVALVPLLAMLACGEPPGSGSPFVPTSGSTPSDDSSEDDDDVTSASTAGDEESASPTSGSSSGEASTGDGSTSGPPTCSPAPSPDPDWLHAYQDDLVAKLSGATEIAAGVSLGERSTPTQRAAAAAFLDDAFAEIGYTPQRQEYPGGSNVFAELPAMDDTASVLVIGAHYDTVPGSPGANDNATGVAVVLALARHLREVECRSHHLLFVLFDQEEIDLVGSDAFAAFVVDEGLPIESVHTIDQMGWDADGDRRVEIERPDAGLFEFYEAPAASLVPPIALTPTQTGSTDHVSFRAHGLPAVGLTEEYAGGDTSPHRHLPSDAYQTVDIDYLVSTTILANLAFSEWIDAS